jgi:hypothetical protein
MHPIFKVEVFRHESGTFSAVGESDGNEFSFSELTEDAIYHEVENQLDSATTSIGDEAEKV